MSQDKERAMPSSQSPSPATAPASEPQRAPVEKIQPWKKFLDLPQRGIAQSDPQATIRRDEDISDEIRLMAQLDDKCLGG